MAAPAPPPATALTKGVTNRIRAGSATRATHISVKPVSTEMSPVPSSRNTLVPASLNATAYTIAAAGL